MVTIAEIYVRFVNIWQKNYKYCCSQHQIASNIKIFLTNSVFISILLISRYILYNEWYINIKKCFRLITSAVLWKNSVADSFSGLVLVSTGALKLGKPSADSWTAYQPGTKYKRRRTVRVSSLIAARQPWCTHTSGIWRRPCEKPCRVSFAPVDVSWSYWSSKPVGGRTAEGMLNQRLWWEMP